MDVHTPSQRSCNMSRTKGKNTKPERVLRRWLWHEGFRYRLHRKDLPGKPDIVFQKKRKVLFVHGCFWHKHDCGSFKWPKTNVAFWNNKISDNVARDNISYSELETKGWRYMVVWECQLDDNESLTPTLTQVASFLKD